jgi:hypothetical protein
MTERYNSSSSVNQESNEMQNYIIIIIIIIHLNVHNPQIMGLADFKNCD